MNLEAWREEESNNNFVTVFDSSYATQALLMARSLRRMCPSARVWMFCVDQEALSIVKHEAQDEPWIFPVAVQDHETEELSDVKQARSVGEYCWTLTPFLPQFVKNLEPAVKMVTYVDADMFFLRDPSRLLVEFADSDAWALVTEHAYASEYDQSSTSGRFCVQFNSFKIDESQPILERWQKQVCEWCFARFDDGKMGDQMYLNEWPDLYGDRIMIVGDEGEFQGPWNALRFPYSSAICFHFHALAWGPRGKVLTGNYSVPKPTLDHVYRPYVAQVTEVRSTITENTGLDPMRGIMKDRINFLRLRLSALRHALRRRSLRNVIS